MTRQARPFAVVALICGLLAGCGGAKLPVASAQPPPPSPAPFPDSKPETVAARPPDPPPVPVDDAPVNATSLLPWNDKPIEVINGPDSPLKPIYFAYDSDQLDELAKKTLTSNADVLRTYRTWVITVEGHCDERGTAEYNLALGDRRAQAARTYLVSLGIAAERMRMVSYGKEFPFDPAHGETAWSKNRRAHFMLTAK